MNESLHTSRENIPKTVRQFLNAWVGIGIVCRANFREVEGKFSKLSHKCKSIKALCANNVYTIEKNIKVKSKFGSAFIWFSICISYFLCYALDASITLFQTVRFFTVSFQKIISLEIMRDSISHWVFLTGTISRIQCR